MWKNKNKFKESEIKAGNGHTHTHTVMVSLLSKNIETDRTERGEKKLH